MGVGGWGEDSALNINQSSHRPVVHEGNAKIKHLGNVNTFDLYKKSEPLKEHPLAVNWYVCSLLS